MKSPYPALVSALRSLQAALYKPEFLPMLLDAITEGWDRGQRAKSLISIRWEDYWERPLPELREAFDLAWG